MTVATEASKLQSRHLTHLLHSSSLSLSLSQLVITPLSHSLSHFYFLPFSYTHSLLISLPLSVCSPLSLSLSLSLSLPLSLTLLLFLSVIALTHFHTLTLSFNPYLFYSVIFPLCASTQFVLSLSLLFFCSLTFPLCASSLPLSHTLSFTLLLFLYPSLT